MLEINKIHCGDCLELMKEIEDKSVDMILCDLPYGTTACKWDIIIDLEKLWKEYKRIIKNKGAIVLTATEPFGSLLRTSNLEMFRYDWIWNKVKPGNILSVKNKPLMSHENIIIFSKSPAVFCRNKHMNYYPIMTDLNISSKTKIYGQSKTMSCVPKYSDIRSLKGKYPKSILTFSNANQKNRLHPTQKPIELFKYLIKTYTNKDDLVLDNCMGSGTTAIACKILKRNYIGIEINKDYCKIANDRLKQEVLF